MCSWTLAGGATLGSPFMIKFTQQHTWRMRNEILCTCEPLPNTPSMCRMKNSNDRWRIKDKKKRVIFDEALLAN